MEKAKGETRMGKKVKVGTVKFLFDLEKGFVAKIKTGRIRSNEVSSTKLNDLLSQVTSRIIAAYGKSAALNKEED